MAFLKAFLVLLTFLAFVVSSVLPQCRLQVCPVSFAEVDGFLSGTVFRMRSPVNG